MTGNATLSDMLASASSAPRLENNELSLHHDGGEWKCRLGNECPSVFLGESEGLYSSGWRSSPEEAVLDILNQLGKV